jgi:hypothetical protein
MDSLRYLVCSIAVGSILCFCRFNPWAALHHLMEYVEGLPSFKITYRHRIKHNQDLLSGYADSDRENCSPASRRSTSGNLMLYNQAPIMWRSKIQTTTALSAAEAEYYSASTAGSDVLYLRKLLDHLGFTRNLNASLTASRAGRARRLGTSGFPGFSGTLDFLSSLRL